MFISLCSNIKNWGPTTIWHNIEFVAFYFSKSLHPTVLYIQMCTQYSLLKYIKPLPNKSEGKMYSSYVHNATQSHKNFQCGIRSCPPFQNDDILPWFLSPSFFYASNISFFNKELLTHQTFHFLTKNY